MQTGGLIGYGENIIVETSYSTSSVKGYTVSSGHMNITLTENAGGLAGVLKNATVSESYAGPSVIQGIPGSSVVKGGTAIGGFVGKAQDSTFTDVFSRATVTGYEMAGFVYKMEGTVAFKNAYFAGTLLVDESIVKEFAPSYANATVSNVFYHSGAQCSVVKPGDELGTPLCTNKIQNADTYPGDWNFKGIWLIDSAVNGGFPYFGDKLAPEIEGAVTVEPGTVKGTTRISGASAGIANRLVVQMLTGSVPTPDAGPLLQSATGQA